MDRDHLEATLAERLLLRDDHIEFDGFWWVGGRRRIGGRRRLSRRRCLGFLWHHHKCTALV
jgi:hypothetical protein